MLMLTLVKEIKKSLDPNEVISMVCGDKETFFTLSGKKQLAAASDMLAALNSHVSKGGTPETDKVKEEISSFPDFIQKKAMVMAIYDLADM